MKMQKNNVINYKLKNEKKGITLIMLIITIVVLLILVGAIIGTTTVAIGDSKKNALAQDLINIEDAVENYYITNNTLPVDNSTVYTLNDLKTLVGTVNFSNQLEVEVNVNGDTDANFYIVDLAKLGVKSTSKGANENGPNDFFVISEGNINAYYLKGVTVDKVTYFSLTPALIKITKVQKPGVSDDGSTTDVTIGGKLKAEKDKKMWTSSLNIRLTVDLSNSTDTLTMISGETAERDITSIVKNTKVLNIPNNLTEVEKSSLEYKKEITLIKKSSGTEVARTTVNVSNIDLGAPSVGTITVNSFSDFNTVNIETGDAESGFAEVRYDYLQKKNSVGTIVDAYTTNSSNLTSVFTASYMKTYGKKADGNVIKLPKYVSKVYIYVFDKAGNYIIRTMEIAPANVTNEPNISNGENKATVPYVPTGFAHIEGDVNTGYVIKDINLGNEFVWIPVNNIDDFKRRDYAKGSVTYANVSESLPSEITTSIKVYGGFYISRYEIGTGVVSKKSIASLVNVNWNSAITNAQGMYNNTEIKTDLIYGAMWDTVCNWLVTSGNKNSALLNDSSTWGNYSNNSATGHGIIQVTGYSENWKTNNIYDLAGNVWEWTQEVYTSTSRVYRGGVATVAGGTNSVVYRNSLLATSSANNIGFRTCLYKK